MHCASRSTAWDDSNSLGSEISMYPKSLCKNHRLSRCQQLVVNLQVLDGHATSLACAGTPELPVHILQHDERQLQSHSLSQGLRWRRASSELAVRGHLLLTCPIVLHMKTAKGLALWSFTTSL